MFHDLYMKTVVAYIENHIAEKLHARVLSDVAGYDEDYFRRVFRNAIGVPPARYVERRRLSHAALHLRNSLRSVSNIALDFGFASHDSFTRAFRREVGCTPSEFRASDRVVKGVFITPGCMGPVILSEEDSTMTENMKADGSNVLYGVPKVSYFNDPAELTPLISSLRACLTYSGQAMPYSRLLSGSGAAFRLIWNENEWDGGNVDILVMRDDPFEPVRRAFRTAGRSYAMIGKQDEPGNRDAMIDLIKTEIDAGRPVIAFGIIGPPEACVLTGYRENGEVLLGWNFFQDFPEWQGGLAFEPCGYFIRRGWYEHSETLGVMAVGAQGQEPDERAFLKDVLTFAAEVMQPGTVRRRASGGAAFDAWKRALLDEGNFPNGAQLPLLMERLMCQGDAFTMISEGRGYAGMFLADEAEKFPDLKCELLDIASTFKKEHETAWDMNSYTGGMGMGENNARELAVRKNRERIADLIDRCKALDAQAIDKILALLGKI